jgi:Putative peptidoglycan binding domain/Transglycosylase SLT domain
MSNLLDELKQRLVAVVDEYKKFVKTVPANTNTEATKPSGSANSITGSVGDGGTNNEADVKKVQNLLNRNGASPALSEDGDCGAATIEAIKKFQQAKTGAADGLIEPNKNTWKALLGQKVENANPNPQTTANANPTGASDQMINSIKPSGASNITAGQDGLDGKGLTGVQVSETMAKTDLERVTKYKDLFVKIGKEQGVPASVLSAIASRETRGREVVGDHGNGFGIIQVDKRFHPEKVAKIEAKQGLARIEESIRQGAIVLKESITAIKAKFPNWTPAQQLKGALAAYNAGVSTVQTLEGMDKGTTGDDYSGDVLARAQFMTKNGFAEETAPANTTKPADPNAKPADTTKPADPNAKPADTTKPADPNAKPVVAAKILTASVGEGGTNKPEEVLLVKTLINKFIPSFNLSDASTNTKVGPSTIVAIKKFQKEKVGSTNPDGLIEVGGKTWKVLNGETPPVTATAEGAPTGGYYSHPNAVSVGNIQYGDGPTARKMIPEAEKLLQSILAKAGLSASDAVVTSTKRSYHDQARILREQVSPGNLMTWYGLDSSTVHGFPSNMAFAEWLQQNAPGISNHIPGYALDVTSTSGRLRNALDELIPIKGSGVSKYLPEDNIGVTHIEFTFEVTAIKGKKLTL